MKRIAVAIVFWAFAGFCYADQAQNVTARMEEDRIVVEVDGTEFTSYLFSEEHKYPFFFPVNGPTSGETLTAWDQEPYPHHSSLYISLDRVQSENVAHANYWQPRHRLDTGQVFSRNPQIVSQEDGRVVLKDEADWIVPATGSHQLRDTRTVTIWAPSPTIRVLDFQFDFEALKDLLVRQTGHSFFSARMRPELAVGCPSRGAAWADMGTGTLVDSEGNRDEAGTRAQAAAWCAAYGQLDGVTEGLAIIQHSENPMYPAKWFNRNYGFFSPTPFAFDGNIEIPAEQKLTFRYRVVVFTGDHETADIAGWHEDFDPAASASVSNRDGSFYAGGRDRATSELAPSHQDTQLVSLNLTVAEDEGVVLKNDPEQGTVRVDVRGEHFTTYHYGDEARTPFLWPVNAEGGVGVTRNYPMGEDEPHIADHPHQRSMYLVYGDVNGHDFWHRERINTVGLETGQSDGFAWLRAHNEWVTADDEVLLEEIQELRFHDTPPSQRLIDFQTTLKATRGEITFGDDKEGLLAFRQRPEIDGRRTGVLTNARGEQGERNVYGAPTPWMDYSGPIEGYGYRGIAVFDHPDNFRVGYWHVRDYGLAAVNPFARRQVGGLDEDGSYTLEEGQSLTLRYRVYVHSGDHEEADVDAQYARYVADETIGTPTN